jgi:hypothetical protein
MLCPPSLAEYLIADNPMRLIDAFVTGLCQNLAQWMFRYRFRSL